MAERQHELPVDIRRKSEVVQDRVGLIIVLSVVAIFTFLLFLLSVNLGLITANSMSALPDVKLLEKWRPNESTRIYDREGVMVANIHGDEDRVVVPLSEISPNIQRAVMAIEDNRFYQHSGIDVRGTFRAMVQNAKGGDIQGGSTLTQQLVKNLFLTPERSISRKVAEAVLSMRVEKHYEKNKILEMYLNQVYWGNQSYGIEKAARRYYKKGASELTIAESALLAGLLKAPEGLSPFAYPEASQRRQREVLAKMVQNGYITPEQYKKAYYEEITLNREGPKPSRHPYFVAHTVLELEREFGRDVVRRGGLKVYTTLDSKVQSAAEKSLFDMLDSLPEYSNVTQGALVVQHVESGEVLALVGGREFTKNQFNNATQAKRPAGSTFKPFVYLTGFRLGVINPDSMTADRPISFNTGYSIWSPKNWDGKFMGAMNIRTALTLSRNTPTVQLGMKVGIDEIIKTAQMSGIESRIDPNFSSVLGSSGMSPMEMTTAYATFARGGVQMTPTVLRSVEDSRGREIPLKKPSAKRVFDADPVGHLVSILVDVVEKGTGRSAMIEGRQVAGKTGTTDNVRDIWFVGFTPDMVASVWMGNEANLALKGVFSSNAAKVWGDFGKQYYQIHPVPSTKFPEPEEILVKSTTIQKYKAEDGEGSLSAPVPLPPPPGGGEMPMSADPVQGGAGYNTYVEPLPVRAGAGGSTAPPGGAGTSAPASSQPPSREAAPPTLTPLHPSSEPR